MLVIDAFNPTELGTPYLLSTISRRVYIVQRCRLTKMKNHRKDYSYYSGCIAGDGDLFAEALRPLGVDKRIGGASLSRALVPTFCTTANPLRLWWLVCKLLAVGMGSSSIYTLNSSRISKDICMIIFDYTGCHHKDYFVFRRRRMERILEIKIFQE